MFSQGINRSPVEVVGFVITTRSSFIVNGEEKSEKDDQSSKTPPGPPFGFSPVGNAVIFEAKDKQTIPEQANSIPPCVPALYIIEIV